MQHVPDWIKRVAEYGSEKLAEFLDQGPTSVHYTLHAVSEEQMDAFLDQHPDFVLIWEFIDRMRAYPRLARRAKDAEEKARHMEREHPDCLILCTDIKFK